MDPVTIALATAAIAAAISGAIAAGDNARAQALRQKAADSFGPEILPKIESLVAQKLDGTELSNIEEDPALRSAQMRALAELENVYRTSGNTQADKAAMMVGANEVGNRASSDYQNIAAMLAKRGGAGGALQAAMYANAGQTAANATADYALRNTVSARDRAMQALMGGANLAGDIRGFDYDVASDEASAQDRINMYNANSQTDADKYNRQLLADEFDRKMRQRIAAANALNGVATGYDQSAQNTRNTGAAIGNAAISAGMGANMTGMFGEKKR